MVFTKPPPFAALSCWAMTPLDYCCRHYDITPMPDIFHYAYMPPFIIDGYSADIRYGDAAICFIRDAAEYDMHAASRHHHYHYHYHYAYYAYLSGHYTPLLFILLTRWAPLRRSHWYVLFSRYADMDYITPSHMRHFRRFHALLTWWWWWIRWHYWLNN